MARTCEYPKGCINGVFGTDANTRKGYCRYHQWCRTDNKKLVAKASSSSVKMFKKKKPKPRPADKKLDEFFAYMMRQKYPMCENCGAENVFLLKEENKKIWKSCMAHLLPKRHFESIKCHPLNLMVMGSGYSGLCNCHDNYDSNWHKASQMKIWHEVVCRFKILYPLIAPEEHQFIPQQLLDTL